MTAGTSKNAIPMQPALEVKDLYYTYPGSKASALNGLSITINKGEIFGLLGPNGAGKTTALSILSTLFKPKSGEFFLFGINAIRHPESIREIIGLIPQELAFYPALTLRENLSYFGHLYGLHGRKLKQRIIKCLEMVNLEEYGNHRVKHLSGGLKRRGNIAVAMINNPKMLFLDEPTSGVDIHTRKLIFTHLRQLKTSGITMIYTTHYVEDAQQLCDRVAIIDNGKPIAEGKPDDLIKAVQGCKNLEDLFLYLTGKNIVK